MEVCARGAIQADSASYHNSRLTTRSWQQTAAGAGVESQLGLLLITVYCNDEIADPALHPPAVMSAPTWCEQRHLAVKGRACGQLQGMHVPCATVQLSCIYHWQHLQNATGIVTAAFACPVSLCVLCAGLTWQQQPQQECFPTTRRHTHQCAAAPKPATAPKSVRTCFVQLERSCSGSQQQRHSGPAKPDNSAAVWFIYAQAWQPSHQLGAHRRRYPLPCCRAGNTSPELALPAATAAA